MVGTSTSALKTTLMLAMTTERGGYCKNNHNNYTTVRPTTALPTPFFFNLMKHADGHPGCALRVHVLSRWHVRIKVSLCAQMPCAFCIQYLLVGERARLWSFFVYILMLLRARHPWLAPHLSINQSINSFKAYNHTMNRMHMYEGTTL